MANDMHPYIESRKMKVERLMGDSDGFMGHGHPRSRDWGLDNIPCKRSNCICNSGNECFIPSRAVIGEDGRCEGYQPKGTLKTKDESGA